VEKNFLQTPKGFRDFPPEEEKRRIQVVEKIRKVFEKFGFEPLETPALEYQEVLLGKYGASEKLIYKFTDLGGRKLALRYDQTVPTARYIAQNFNKIIFPFKRYQIQPVWRAEKPQKGRFREFIQCDADIFGEKSEIADAEIIALTHSIYQELGFKNFKIYLNDREILFRLLKFVRIPEEFHLKVIAEIDKLDRKKQEEVELSIRNLGIDEKEVLDLFHHLKEQEPTERLRNIINFSQLLGVEKEKLFFHPGLARGLDYYTGFIFEVKIDEYSGGSVGGGGRYDNLIKIISGLDVPAVGLGIGFDRTIEAMAELGLFPKKKRAGCLVSIFNQELTPKSLDLAKKLRLKEVKTELYPETNASLDKQLKYADRRGVKFFIVIGPEESRKDTFIVKNLETGFQKEVFFDELILILKSE